MASVAPVMADLLEALADGLQRDKSAPHLRAALALVLDFNTWRLLVRRGGLSDEHAGSGWPSCAASADHPPQRLTVALRAA